MKYHIKIATVIGARPQFIKAAAVSRALSLYNDTAGVDCKMREVIIHTGQHYDQNMSEVFFKQMRIPDPDYHLGIGGDSHGAMTGRMIEALEKTLIKESPDAVLVYGDTNSTLSGALAAVKLHIHVAHVEAGLRSLNFSMPEEVNRIVADRVSRWLFCPSETAVKNLLKEGMPSTDISADKQHVENTGDVMYDAAMFYKDIAEPSKRIESLTGGFKGGFYLATVHRAENTDDTQRLKAILSALDDISHKIPVVLPIHPRTRKFMDALGLGHGRISVTEPVGYFEMIYLLSNCRGVFTDSGGLQKEAYFFKRPCATLRDETEWVELVDAGCNELTGADYGRIKKAEQGFGEKNFDFSVQLYGDGHAGQKIIKTLSDSLI